MLGATCSSCCSQPCDCQPDFITVDVADEDRLGIHESFGSDLQWASQAQTSGGSPLPQGYNSLFHFGASDFIVTGSSQLGGHFACQSPSSAAGMCMRLTRPRLLAFRDAIRGSYQLTRTTGCKDYVYVNDAPCEGNFIRSLRLSLIEDTTAAYGAQVRKTMTPGTNETPAVSFHCTPTFSTYPSQGKTGWIEYRMTAEACIAGDAGNKVAAGCAQNWDSLNFFSGIETDPSRCNCYPDTIAIQRQFAGAYFPGQCNYSGATCHASMTFHSVGSLFNRSGGTLSAFNIVGQPYNRLDIRAIWSRVTESVPALTNPARPAFWCEVSDSQIRGSSVTGDSAGYDAAQCFQIPRDIYFGLFTRSPLANAMRDRTYWDSIGFGVRLRPNVTP